MSSLETSTQEQTPVILQSTLSALHKVLHVLGKWLCVGNNRLRNNVHAEHQCAW